MTNTEMFLGFILLIIILWHVVPAFLINLKRAKQRVAKAKLHGHLSISPTEANISALRALWSATPRKPFPITSRKVSVNTILDLHDKGFVRQAGEGVVLTPLGHANATILMKNQWQAP